jgi:hypothetical protein
VKKDEGTDAYGAFQALPFSDSEYKVVEHAQYIGHE